MSITLSVVRSSNTVELRDAAIAASQSLVNAVAADMSYKTVTELNKSSRVAINKLSKSEQTDAFNAIIASTPTRPVETLCAEGLYAGYSFPAKDGIVSAKENGTCHIYDLSSAIPAFNAAGITSISPAWQTIAVDAVKVAAIVHVCSLRREGKDVCPDIVYSKLNASSDVANVCLKDDGTVRAKLDDARSMLQNAVNIIFGLDENGKPRYFVKSADVRAVMAQFRWDDSKNALVIPRDETKIRIFFNMLRAVVGGTEYDVVVEQEKKEEEKEEAAE